MCQAFRDGGGILAAVEDAPDLDFLPFDTIIGRVGKAPRQRAGVAEHLPMNAGIQQQGVDIREQRIEEVIAEPRLLPFVKAAARFDIIDRDGK